MILKITLSIVILSAMVYLAISKKSSFQIRLAALGALALMIITVIICLVRIFNKAAAGPATQAYPDMPVTETAPPNGMVLVSFIVFLLVLFAVILLLSLREQRRAANAANSANAINPNKEKFSLDSI
jgi:ABC-type Fe3+ transport system permease subunit